MHVINDKVVLLEDEVSNTCPKNILWASAMVRLYGPDTNFKGRLKHMSKCAEVLRSAGYEVFTAKTKEEAKRLVAELEAGL